MNAAAVYSACDPYVGITNMDDPPCVASTQPTQVPILLVGRNCDLLACDMGEVDAQRYIPGADADAWFKHLQGVLGDPAAQRIMFDAEGSPATGCIDSQCTEPLGVKNHLNWTDGIADQGGTDTERAMLELLRTSAM